MNRHSELFFLLLALSAVSAEVVQWRPCTSTETDVVQNCTIHEVRVEPCKEATEGKPCKMKRGVTGNITYEYTPAFAANKLEGRVYWSTEFLDIPFLGLNPDACLATNCPAVAGQRSTYSVELPVSKKYPVRMYDLKWKLWNEHQQECCLMFQVKITK